MNWTIEAKILPLVAGLTGHLYLEVFDSHGHRVAQINGLATDPKTNRPRPMGQNGDVLRIYIDNQWTLHGTAKAMRDKHPHEGRILFSGTEEEVRRALDVVEIFAKEVNTQNVPYVLLGTNSNTAFVALVEVIEKAVPVDRVAFDQMTHIRKVMPGVRSKLPPKGNDNRAA